ncbi:hypothetical protein ACF0H5_000832 [Mactra antiquata]
MDRRNPVIQPFFTLDEVLSWKPGRDELCVAKVEKRTRKVKNGPKLIVCHDFKGGYLEDRLIQGCGRPQAYRFYHWLYVDIFIYFSHYFVTIPPPSWTNAAHRHGVTVLGTIITEWDDGKGRCETFLKDEESYKQFADQLVEITKYYNFDGWLVNIENVIESSEMVSNLTNFVKYLTEKLHKHVPGSKVIWYDSVIDTGKLDWQNALNDKNSQYFNVSDGIFLNYCWKDEHLIQSKQYSETCDRQYDVYVGIDVFGRGCLGDGGYNTREALEAISKHNLSVAIFAPGWVYETQGAENFTHNENKFWCLLDDYLTTHSFISLPINTSFCQGFGERFFDNGVPVGNPWWNVNIQQLQPTFTQAQFLQKQTDTLLQENSNRSATSSNQSRSIMSSNQSASLMSNNQSSLTMIGQTGLMSDWNNKNDTSSSMMSIMGICTDDAFIGGSSLKLQAEVVHSKFVKYSLFSLDVDLKQYTSVYVSVTYKILQDPDCDIFLELHLQHDDQSIVLVLLPFPDGDKPVPTFGKDKACLYVYPMNQSALPKLLQLSSPQSNNTRWKTRWFPVYSLYLKFCKLKLVKVGLTTTDPQPKTCIALLGDLKILQGDELPDSFPTVEFSTVVPDITTSYPLLNVGKNNFNNNDDNNTDKPQCIEWGVDACGNPINIPINELDKMRVSCHTLREFRPSIGGQLCEVLYQLITSLDCFTVHWKVDNPGVVDHYRLYQIKIDSGVAKLLGHVTEPYFKVTWFEIPDYEKDELTHHFKFVIRPVLKNGIVVPLDYNYCQLFHIASKKESVTLVKDSCTSVTSEAGCEHEQANNETDDTKTNTTCELCDNKPTNQIVDIKELTNEKTASSNVTNQNAGEINNESTDDIENLTQNLSISDKKSE